MNLRRKLLTIFSALALMSLVVASVTVWVTFQWRNSNELIENHYRRSLLLQRVRSATFRAFKEVPDAVTGDDPDSREEFEEYIAPALQDFQTWAELADSEEERRQIAQIRAAHDELVRVAHETFDLVEAGRMREAFELMEGKLEDNDFVQFQNLSDQAVESDRQYRDVIREQNRRIKRTAQIVLAVAAFGTVSLILLLAAYLASDLFKPLHEVEEALNDVARGDLKRRLSEERADELGAISTAFNRMIEAVAEREQLVSLAVVPAGEAGQRGGGEDGNWQSAPSRLTLHRLVSQLRARVTQLSGNGHDTAASDEAQQQEALKQLDQLLTAVSRITEFGFPLDLNLARTDIRALLYEVLLRFHDNFAARAVSFELNIAPPVNHATIDRLKLREALAELIRNALAALPESGGQIGIRSSIDAEQSELLIEIVDNGKGAEQSFIDRALAGEHDGKAAPPGVGLTMTKAVVEQHGGQLEITSEAGQGTYVQIKLPLRD
ncbi:MAG: ATP-binding protein [Pyrinomonadaceae bacterium]